MDEFELIERFFTDRGVRRADVRMGIGDDAAITRVPASVDLVIATDALVAGTHFPANTPPRSIGHRALAVNLSDLAAMGAEPLWCTLALTLPEVDADWIGEFATGFFALAEQHGIALIGGDTVRGPLAVSVTVHGSVPQDAGVRRSGANPGELIFVTGSPGLAVTGLQQLQNGSSGAKEPDALEKFLYPAPRVREGLDLRDIATAMIDVSDGLAIDAQRLLATSHIGADFDIAPLLDADNIAAEQVLAGGDDYELLFCVAPDRHAELLSCAQDWACALTQIGVTSTAAEITWRSGNVSCVPPDGFVHFG